MSEFDVILVDPPWKFRVWNRATGSGRSAESYYRTMSLDELKALQIPAAKNAALFMWTVWPSIFDSATLMQAWRFKYKTLGFEWWKLNKRWERAYQASTQSGVDYRWLERLFFFGMGYYTRACSEPCLLAIRGSMPVAVHNERNFIIAPVRSHSQKPDEQYEKIERLYPGRRYLEIFARTNRPGWTSVGYELDGMDIRDSLKELADA